MKSIYSLTLVCVFLLITQLLSAQNTHVVTGRITAAATNEPLPGVTVQIKGVARGATTGTDGSYRIIVPQGNTILVFSYIGYLPQEQPIQDRTVLNITLQPDTRNLDQVVVTAMGIRKEKRALGYAVQEVSGADLTQSKQSNVVNALQGKVAGVQISSTGGAPGQGSRILIRGVNSLDPTRNNQPLFVVDGITIDNETYTTGRSEARGMSNRAADINPDDIESVNVLKGGAATALYGLRAANGAVIITTKSGKAGRVRLSYSTSAGFDKAGKTPDVQTGTARVIMAYMITRASGHHGDQPWKMPGSWTPPIPLNCITITNRLIIPAASSATH